MNRWLSSGLAIVLLAVPPATRAAEADRALGHQLVATYCADCHAIEPTGDSPFPAAPPFRTLGARYDVGLLEEALVEGLVSTHEAMPEFEFDPDQAQAIIAYLESLQPAAQR